MHFWFVYQLQHGLRVHERNRYGSIGFLAHELAHRYFGWDFGLRSRQRELFGEPFASFLELKAIRRFARTELMQTFRNDTARRLEATYVFPIPENADLTNFQMTFNGKPLYYYSGDTLEPLLPNGMCEEGFAMITPLLDEPLCP